MHRYFEKELLAGVLNDINQSKTTTISHATTTRSHRVRFNGNLVPEKLDYAKAKTFQTPTKAKKRVLRRGMLQKKYNKEHTIVLAYLLK